MYHIYTKHLIYSESTKDITRRIIKVVTCFARMGTKEEQRGKKGKNTPVPSPTPFRINASTIPSRFLSPLLKKDWWFWFAIHHNLLLQISKFIYSVLFFYMHGSSKLHSWKLGLWPPYTVHWFDTEPEKD